MSLDELMEHLARAEQPPRLTARQIVALVVLAGVLLAGCLIPVALGAQVGGP